MTEVPDGFPRLDKATRPWTCRRGEPSCTRTAPCRSCLGKRNRRKGMTKQRAARKVLESTFGAVAARFVGQLGNEEAWSGLPVRVEVKSGAQVGPIATRYVAAAEQSDASKAIGDTRPFVMVAMPAGWTDGLLVVRLSDLDRVLDLMGDIE